MWIPWKVYIKGFCKIILIILAIKPAPFPCAWIISIEFFLENIILKNIDPNTGIFQFDVEQVYTNANFESDLGDAIAGGTGITYDSSTDTISITNTGVTAATYGSASLVPVLKINAQGQIDSAGTTSVKAVKVAFRN